MSMFGSNPKKARERYIKLVYVRSDKKLIEDIELKNEKTEYRSQRAIPARNIKAEEIIKFIINKMGISQIKLRSKNCKNVVEAIEFILNHIYSKQLPLPL